MITREQAEAIVSGLQEAWNAADGTAFAAPFSEDADFVTVAGMHARGRQSIAENHDRIFATVYKGSKVAMRVEQLRPLSGNLALLHIAPTLDVPAGPLAGTMNALMTTVIDDSGGQPKIVALHNTIVRDLGQAAGRAEPMEETKA